MNQERKIDAPTEAELDGFVEQIAPASSLAIKVTGRALEGSRGDLPIIQQILDSKAIEQDQPTLQALGMAFGLAFIGSYSGYDWWMVEDEQGRRPVIRFGETSLLAFPQFIISQHLEKGARINVEELFETFKQQMDDLGRQQGLDMEKVRLISRLADRGDRLGACIIDSLIMIFFCLPLFIYLVDDLDEMRNLPASVQAALFLQSVVIFLLLNGNLLHKHGQTIGKRVMGIAITDTEGRVVDVWHVIALRYGVFWALGLVPFIGRLVCGSIDPLCIFRKDRRCLHDHLAGTIVIKCH
ncbi:MAG TPA: DUF3806 domain-containing protein [Gammaproteobacteria bacterium]|nr:DUF3806 domain-containing protein [Gammaproteobacteria bacterium]